MNRTALAASAALVRALAFASAASAQAAKPQASKATPATPTAAPAAPARAKFAPVVKGVASLELIQGKSNKVGPDIVTVLKVKNLSSGAIGLLRVDELWYDKKLQQVTGDSQKLLKPLQPGEVAEITMKSPWKADLYRSQYAFSHANGKVDVKAVKKFTE